MTRLVRPSPNDTVSIAQFKGLYRHQSKSRPSCDPNHRIPFLVQPCKLGEPCESERSTSICLCLRHYLEMANDLNGKELLVRHITNADRTVLRELADLAERLGFESPKIITLKENPHAIDA